MALHLFSYRQINPHIDFNNRGEFDLNGRKIMCLLVAQIWKLTCFQQKVTPPKNITTIMITDVRGDIFTRPVCFYVL